MGPFPRVLLSAGFSLMKWLFFITAALLAILVVMQQVRGDAEAAPMELGVLALVMAGLGWVSSKASGWFVPGQ